VEKGRLDWSFGGGEVCAMVVWCRAVSVRLLQMMTWWFTTFMAPAIKNKVHNLPGVEFLYGTISQDELEIPAFITEHDMTINGIHYFHPEQPA